MKPASSVLLFAVALGCRVAAAAWPGVEWEAVAPKDAGLDAGRLAAARAYALSGGGAGCVVRHGRLAMCWGDAREVFDLKSSTKAIGVTALGLALADGKVSLDDPARKFHPTFGTPPDENARRGWTERITLRMLANQTAGFEKPGGFGRLLFEPGTRWNYSDGGPNWLAECLTLIYRRDLNDLLFERVFTPIGIKPADLRWRPNAYRPREIAGIARREFGSGISANVSAMARIGLLYLRGGAWNGRPLLPADFVRTVSKTGPELAGLAVHSPQPDAHAATHYGLLWWNNNDGTLAGVPRDAFWSWGLHDSLIVVIPSLDLVVARAGRSWKRAADGGHYDVLQPFLEPICAGVAGGEHSAPPPSPVIREIRWAPMETILRRAKGSDNWPMTWGDDDAIYTAYGDGHGFAPFLATKLSLGLARIEGQPDTFTAANLRAPTLEATGDGAKGRKASGLLMMHGTLFVLVRNAGNAQLGWSSDRGATWAWADWKFTNSFGCPAFVNFGRNHAGARDEFVYVVSHDSDSAYERAGRFVLARVPAQRIRERAAWEYFVRLDAERPVWSANIADRGAIFSNPGRCYRSSMSHHAGLGRFLWCQTGPDETGFSILDAPEPWGPWTTAFATDRWDVAPGEAQHLPVKWISSDGTTLRLVYSGDDAFNVREGRIVLHPAAQPAP